MPETPTAARVVTRPGAIVSSFRGVSPRLHESAWVAPGASVIGQVEIGADSSVFYGTVVRGDVERIQIGERTNIQDNSTVHVTVGRYPTWIGDDVTVGHRAVVHGCRVGSGALIGIGAIVLDGAIVGENALVAAGALVAPGVEIEAGWLAMGIPARPVRRLEQEEIDLQRERTLEYVATALAHREAHRQAHEHAQRAGDACDEGV